MLMATPGMQVFAMSPVTQGMKELVLSVGDNAHLIMKNAELFVYLQELAQIMSWV